MNGQLTCALADHAAPWSSIDWPQTYHAVKKNAGAYREGNAGRPLEQGESLATAADTSFYGKALAVKRVTENQGKRTPGVDGKLWSTQDAKAKAVGSLRYQPRRSSESTSRK